MLGAQAALDAGVPYVLVLPYPDPQSVWPQAEQAEFARLADGAQDVITLQKKAPEDKQKARGAIGRRDAWFARNAKEALIVWDNEDADVGRLVRSMQDALGELDMTTMPDAALTLIAMSPLLPGTTKITLIFAKSERGSRARTKVANVNLNPYKNANDSNIY